MKSVKCMRKIIFPCVASVFCLLLFAGCSYGEAKANRQKLNLIRVGMTQAEVREIMGAPLEKEKYHSPDVWFYYTDPKWYDGVYTRDECTPFVFGPDGKLTGFGYEYYKRVLDSDAWRRRQLDQQL